MSIQRKFDAESGLQDILSENEARFLAVGAYAMATHGYPRATGMVLTLYFSLLKISLTWLGAPPRVGSADGTS